jgi:hypothetical protein
VPAREEDRIVLLRAGLFYQGMGVHNLVCNLSEGEKLIGFKAKVQGEDSTELRDIQLMIANPSYLQ